MRKYILAFFVVVTSTWIVSYLYIQSRSHLALHHQKTLSVFAALATSQFSLEKEILKSRGLKRYNEDAMPQSEEALKASCKLLLSKNNELTEFSQGKLSVLVEKFCHLTEIRLEKLQTFKSKIAVIQDNLENIQVSVARNFDLNERTEGELIIKMRDLIRLTFTYYQMPTPRSRQVFESTLKAAVNWTTSGQAQAQALETLIGRSQTILRETDDVETLLKGILPAHSSRQIEILGAEYSKSYDRAEASATSYRRILYGTCIALLFIAILQMMILVRMNATLERRVLQRTEELNQTINLVSTQKAVIVASAKTSALGEMAGQIAHEINTPLGTIILSIQSIKKKLTAPHVDVLAITKQLDLVIQVTNKMSRIVGSMRKLAGHGTGDSWSEVSVEDLVEDTLLLCEGRFRKDGITFRKSFDGLGKILCNGSEISQVLVNLLNNAYDAVKEAEVRQIELSVTIANGRTTFSVTDSGQGISSENRAKLFQPNFSTKSLDQGTGFGLSISKKIAERHHGRIYLDIDSSQTRFVLELPNRQDEALLRHAKAG